VELALPEERKRIRELLERFPRQIETKVEKLISALGTLWKQDPSERVVVFATYLGSVEMLGERIDQAYPGQGVVVLKGGDHGSKLAAERRFKQADGPKVMICTTAGREGINLQHARVLFNFDLPWNPMDIEQRIGRIHRYGQRHTAQVYNLVLSDTIEGKIFLLLDDKLKAIAKALGKVDEQGEVAEDLRTQILGQLSERLSYETLYAQALSDPELKRTRLELEAAVANADEARQVVFELFQDLDRFSLEDYEPFSDTTEGMDRIVRFVQTALAEEGQQLTPTGNGLYAVTGSDGNGQPRIVLTTHRDQSLERQDVQLLGLDHPLVASMMARYRSLAPQEVGIRVKSPDGRNGVLSLWSVTTHGERGETKTLVVPLAIDGSGQRLPSWERQPDRLFQASPSEGKGSSFPTVLTETIEPMLQRELQHRGVSDAPRGYDARLIGWIEATGK